MTQEEKAKRYDEAIKRAKGVIEQNPLMEYLKKGIEYILPELKESGDERMLNLLKKYVHYNISDLALEADHITREQLESWLEKQGEQDPYNGVSFKYNGHTWGMCARDNGVDILLDRQLIKHLEKQGEQKQDPCEHCADKRLNCHNFPCIKKRAFKQGKSALEAIIDEKVDNANKVEPKFKDGDVLKSPSHHLIWIYKDNEHYYACVNMNYVTKNVAIDGLLSIPKDACPATREQRKQLEKAMVYAGYIFDFKKKELKKIEDKIEIPFGAKDSELQEATYYIPKGFHAEIDDNKVVIKKGEKPTAWSEWDEINLEKAIWYVENPSPMAVKNSMLVEWLKSLKGRVCCEVKKK